MAQITIRMKRLLLSIYCLLPLYAAANDGWTIVARDTSGYTPAAVANGEIGMVIGHAPFAVEPVIAGSAYDRGNSRTVSRIRHGICPLGLSISVDGQPLDGYNDWEQQIDMRRAAHTTRFTTDGLHIVCTYRALRNMPYALTAEVEIHALRNAQLTVTNCHRLPDDLSDTLRQNRTVWCEDGGRKVQRSEGSYNGGRDRMVATSVFLCGDGFREQTADSIVATLRKGQRASFTLIGILCTTADFSDPWNESERQAIYAAREGSEALVAAHERAWSQLWQSDIVVEGDPQAQSDIRFALYNLYSSIREGSRRSIPPMGLTAQGYNGHIFWDAEIWMFPALVVLHPELARQMLDYRFDRLDAARRRAYAHGYRGAMFPWESDDRGEESTPTFALTGPLEHHITADVGIAAWQYYCVTHDVAWLRREGWPLLREGAAFWCDRVQRNDDGSYSIANVVGADEYAIGVTDNAFTNGAVRRALEYAAKAAALCGEQPDPRWAEIAARLRILQLPDGTTREHATYDGEQIKQADANLLGYPLGIVTGREALLRDLSYYKGRIDPENGPAMSYSVFAVQYARLGLTDEAYAMFRRAYEPNLRPPLRVFAESPTSNNPYFMTGAGGLLQAVLFGFGGLEITPEGVVRHPVVLPSHWKALTITGSGTTPHTASPDSSAPISGKK